MSLAQGPGFGRHRRRRKKETTLVRKNVLIVKNDAVRFGGIAVASSKAAELDPLSA